MEIHRLGVTELARAYRSDVVTPAAAVEAYLDRISALDDDLGAYVAVYSDEARRAGEERTEELRAGRQRGPLHGIPIALKDLIEVEGRRTMAGSAAWRDRVSTVTATIVRRLEDAGAIILGKLHTVEFAFGGWGTNPHLGTPRNPWGTATHRVPGGSSSGAGVAVAAGLAAAAVGTDTGGSVRLPSSFCGVTGLKTTKGLVSCHGIVPMAPSFDTPGPIARSAADAALLLGVLAGEDPLDPFSRRASQPTAPHKSEGYVLGRVSAADYPGSQAAVWQNYNAALAAMAAAGTRVREIALPCRLTDYVAQSIVLEAEAYAEYGKLAEDGDKPLGKAVRARILKGRVPASDYLQGLWRLPQLRREFLAALDGVDALVTPTTLVTAPRLGDVDEATTPAVLTRFVNILGLCALALPNGVDGEGMPTSLQIVGRPFDEARILAVGEWYQCHSDWHTRWPAQM
ncbi:MAG: amidase [Rhizobiaceae bacterium]|nr:amidase [Rhizobiaceae bacterium]